MVAEAVQFEPGKYLTLIDGRDYLEVKWRLLWLRTEHPDAVIETELVKEDGVIAIFKAQVTIPGRGTASGWGSENTQDFRDYIEKAETKALGRALAALGFGTQFCQDFDFGAAERGRVVDSPVDFQGVRGMGGGRRAIPGERATERQVKAIYAIGRAGHLSDGDIAQRAQEQFGCTPEQLSRRDASTFIDTLKQEMAVGASQASA
jgi:hypothetical protein